MSGQGVGECLPVFLLDTLDGPASWKDLDVLWNWILFWKLCSLSTAGREAQCYGPWAPRFWQLMLFM